MWKKTNDQRILVILEEKTCLIPADIFSTTSKVQAEFEPPIRLELGIAVCFFRDVVASESPTVDGSEIRLTS